MKFFVPVAEDDEQAERVWNTLRESVEQSTKWPVSDTHIYRIEYVHDGERLTACVGQTLHDGLVIAIFESTTYLICTPNRGVGRGDPIMVGKDRVQAIELFSLP